MASRIIHLTISSELEKSMKIIKNVNRFRIGHILPDAIIHGEESHATSHYKIDLPEGNKKMMNFHGFYNQFSAKILQDDLYLGYYLHLIQDAVYRKYLYYECDFLNKKGRNLREALHKDYAVLNSYLVNTYNLINDIEVPVDFISEEINEIYPFRLKDFLEDMAKDFAPSDNQKITHFTHNMAEKYIKKCVLTCQKELKEIKNSSSCLNPIDYAWEMS